MSPARRVWARLSFAALAAIVARLAVAIAFGGWSAPARFESDLLARSLLSGEGYVIEYLGATYRSFHSILPYDGLTLVAYVAGGTRLMLVFQALLSALHAIVAGRLGARLGVGGLAAWAVALWPPLVYYDACTLSQIGLDALLFSATCLAALRLRERPGLGRALVAGLLVGLLLHERPTFVLAAALLLVWASQASHTSPRLIAIACGVVFVVLLPWALRNAVVHGRYLPFSTTAWVNLWKGNNPHATGTELDERGVPQVARLGPALEQAIRGAPELAQMDAFREATLRFVREQPGTAAMLYGKKLGYFAWHTPVAGAEAPRGPFRVYRWAYALALLFVIVALARRREPPQRQLLLLLVGVVALYGAVQSLGFIAGRHRATAEAPLLVVAAAAFLRRPLAIAGIDR